ncbi:MAG TPA: A24 family peptidase [Cellvibrionaceae bacterium]|nr:A24 family peptidase [Cellvibrionaceae bacterium]
MTLADLHSLAPGYTLTIALILGLLIGSFLNVVIYRLPLMMMREWKASVAEAEALVLPELPERFNLATPRSRCPHCQAPITALQNVPVVSFLLLKGRCSSCKTSISPRYPIVEAVTGLLSLVVVWHLGVGWVGLLGLVLVWTLVALTMIDVDHQLLPDNLTLPLLWLGLVANSFSLFVPLSQAVWGAVVGYLSLWSVYWVFKLLTGKEGMGYGDFKLLAALGAWMGWQAVPLIIVLSSLVGAVIGGAAMILAGRGRDFRIPFGPYLVGAGFIAFIWGEQLIALYKQFSGLA